MYFHVSLWLITELFFKKIDSKNKQSIYSVNYTQELLSPLKKPELHSHSKLWTPLALTTLHSLSHNDLWALGAGVLLSMYLFGLDSTTLNSYWLWFSVMVYSCKEKFPWWGGLGTLSLSLSLSLSHVFTDYSELTKWQK